ncbi:UvrD-helicase domain-containing protein [Aquimarina macrocephali]|uniref:UvrD-helicase domain-containing protein n=1 Tax=Aquimarina macrocephali TaxID=666563 RepID=UPI003F66896A
MKKGNTIDDSVDTEIFQCINPSSPKSFFLFAGAGSGKTRSLVNVLSRFKIEFGHEYKLFNQKIAIITYTNAAADEIKHRLEFDPIFYVSTIHSFAWELIKPLTIDIKEWLKIELQNDLNDLKEAQSKSRNLANKTSIDRARKIESKEKRLSTLSQIHQFIYNPNGDNISKASLNHSEVINITAHFVESKALMQDIIVSKFPVLFIDESQDTKKELIDAFFELQKNKKESFSLGLFGDTMQRIYADGKQDLGNNLPSDWLQPAKKMNHRSNKRIIKLINEIRKDVDGQKQIPRIEKADGTVRLFVSDRTLDKALVESKVAQKMSEITKDVQWILGNNEAEKSNVDIVNFKTLILEHHMAANRMGFFELFEPLYKVDKIKTSLLDGSLSGLNLFGKTILPLLEAYRNDDKFSMAKIIKRSSPLFQNKAIEASKDQIKYISSINEGVNELLGLWNEKADPQLIRVLEVIKKTGLFPIPGVLNLILARTEEEKTNIDVNIKKEGQEDEYQDDVINAWDVVLQTPFSQIENYNIYLSQDSAFATHQGVKGLEYPRVMVVIDDEEARGFMFSYDKLFGSKELTDRDKKNITEGQETGIDRTKRLFYVACSRAKESLAIIAYTDNPRIIKNSALKYGWFDESEIEILK